MRRKLITSLLVLGLLLAGVLPAAASPTERSVNPVRYCQSVYGETSNPFGQTYEAYLVPVRFTFGGMTFVDEEFALSSFQACVSTVAGGFVDGAIPSDRVSTPAYIAQCDLLEAWGVVTYPYAFYGLYPAENRADCVRILKGVHSGQLALPEGPPNG
jgi:hypothetical protein